MARILIATVLALALAFTAEATIGPATTVIGGATSISALATALGNSSLGNCTDQGTYAAVGSSTGIAEFLNGTYVVGVSDQPLTKAQETTPGSVAVVYGRCTIPVVISRFAFFAKTSSGVDGIIQLTAQNTFDIYYRGGNWSTYVTNSSIISGPINRVARKDGSGTTFTIKLYWIVANTTYASLFPTAPDGTPFPFPGLDLQTGTGALCTECNTVTGSICYAQTGLCLPYGKLTEIAIPDKAGIYVVPSQANANASVPRQLPPYCGSSWSSVGTQFILNPGPNTCPIASFEYSFIRQKGLAAAGALGAKGKSTLLCWLNKAQSLAATYNFAPLPSSIQSGAIAAVNSVTN